VVATADAEPAELCFGLSLPYLRKTKGFFLTHNRMHQINRELGLSLRIKPKKRMNRAKPEPLTVPKSLNAVWSMDYMHDQLTDRQVFRSLAVVKDFYRKVPGIKIEFSLPSDRVTSSLDQIKDSDGIRTEYIQPGKRN
jgi:putative transposase